MNFLSAAADLVSLGFKVVPLVPGQKLPLVKGWQKIASDDADVIGGWANQWPNANIGVATGAPSGVSVLDLDVKDGRNGMQDVATLASAGKKLPPCPVALTPSGGRHLFFRHAPGLKNVVGVTAAGRGIGPGVDVRADGGFVVAPPSALPNGTYRWLIPPMTPDFPRLPEWAVRMLLPPPPQSRAPYAAAADGVGLDGPAGFAARAPNGMRNKSLFWAACRAGEAVARGEITEAHAISKLTEAAAAAGLRGTEVGGTIASGLRRGQQQGASRAA